MSNREKLERWYKDIEKYKKLNIKEAKELLIEINSTDNINKKKELREELILGTLYLGYNILNNILLLDLNYNYFDIEDLINAFVLEWIKVIDSDKILNCHSFAYILRSDIYNKIFKSGANVSSLYTSFVGRNCFDNIFIWYFSRKNKFDKVSYNEFYNYLNNIEKRTFNDYMIFQLYVCFEQLDSLFELNSIDVDNILKLDNINKYKEFLLSYLNNDIYNDGKDVCVIDDNLIMVERVKFNKSFMEYILKNKKINNKLITIMNYRYGFSDGKCYKENEIAEKLELTHQRVNQLERQLGKRILKMKKINNYKEGYYE